MKCLIIVFLVLNTFYVITKTVVYRKQNNVHALNWPICSTYLLPNWVDRRAHKLKDHNNMVGLEKTERPLRIEKPQTHSTLGTKRKKKRQKKNSKEN